MKLITYGDIVSFKLPSDWKEEYYDDGNAVFYREDGNSGTLRLSVQSIESEKGYAESVELSSESDIYVQDGFQLEEEVKLTNEGGDDNLVYSWKIIIPVDSKEKKIIWFSYIILASQEGELSINLELNFIRNTILKARYGDLKSN